MKEWRHTVRLRLAVWYALSIVLMLAAFGALLHEVVRYQLERHHDADLMATAATVVGVLSTGEELDRLSPEQLAELDAIRHVVVVAEMRPGGQIVYASAGSSGIRHSDSGEARRPGEGRFATLSGDREPLRVYSEADWIDDRQGGVLVHVAHELGDMPATLTSLRLGLLLMAPLVALLSAVGGYWLAGRALAPVDAVTRMAREVSASSLGRRLDPPRANDEIGRLVDTFNAMIARLESSFEAMKRFTADASHELRGPLTTMRSAIDVCLSRPREPDDYRETLANVGEDVDRLRAISEDLLVLARADVGRIPLDRQPVRLDVIAGEVLESFRVLAAERHVFLGIEHAEPVLVEGDERWLRQLVFNLFDNAVKFSLDSSGDSRGSVSLSVVRDEGMARLQVADNGTGIPEHALPHLFERFFRSDDARSYQRRDGFGLGLAIAAWVAEAHGGRISAANRPGGGGLFSVSLPLAEEHDPGGAKPTRA